jgi:predicted permease
MAVGGDPVTSSFLTRVALRMVPEHWRESVARDLAEEAARGGRRGLARNVWFAWQALCVAARLRLGGRARVVQPRPEGGGRVTNGLRSDLHVALRLLARQPASAATIVLTLALGIGATTSVYAVFNHVLFRPVPGVLDEGRLVTVLFQPPDEPNSLGAGSRAVVPFFRQAATLSDLATFSERQLPIAPAPGADPEIRRVQFVTSRYFETLGVRALRGRLLTDVEAHGSTQVAVVSQSYWASRLASDVSVIGGKLIVNGHPFTVVGIMDRYRGWSWTRIGTVDVWLPMGVEHLATGTDGPEHSIEAIIARRRPDASVEAVTVELGAIQTGMAGSLDDFSRRFVPVAYAGLYEFGQDRFRQGIMQAFPFLMGGASLLLLLSCANTANLLLARARRRARDLALQAALGASRARLMRGLLGESAVLAIAAGAGGLGLAALAARGLRGLQVFRSVPEVDDLAIDVRVAAFAAAVAACTVVAFGLLPALRTSKVDLRALLPSTALSVPRSRRLRSALVASQLAISLTLLAAAGGLARSLVNLRSIDVGMRTDDVVSITVNPRVAGYNVARRDRFVHDALARLQATAGLDGVAYASPPALWSDGWYPRRVRIDAALAQPDVEVDTAMVSGTYFEVLGIPLLSGRTFTAGEFQKPPGKAGGVAIVSESLARQLFGQGSAIGRSVARGSWRLEGPAVMSFQRKRGEFVLERELEVVGVVADTRSGYDLRAGERAALYEPGGQRPVYGSFYVRSARPAAETVAAVRRVMREIAPGVPLTNVGTVRDAIERLIPEERLFARVMAIVAVLALLLGVAGTYAVMSYTVSERTRELGIRAALGAAPLALARGVLARALAMCAAGLVAGLALSAVGARVLSAKLYGVSALDPFTLAPAMLVLAAATAAAAWLPARRATRIDPALVLKD